MKLTFFTTLKSSFIHLNGFTAALIAAMILGGAQKLEGKRLTDVYSQKEAIELLKSQGKLLPNVPTDYGHYGRFYTNVSSYVYHTFPYGTKRQRYESDNLKDIDGKDVEIDNDLDSCMFLNETVYKSNLDKIIPIIIDTQIDTINAAQGEYERVDWDNSWSFIGGIPNRESITYKSGKGVNFGSHMNAMADVLIAKKDNFVKSDYDAGLDVRVGKEEVGIRPGKVRLYTNCPALGGNVETEHALKNIYDEAKNNPDKKYILSCSWTGAIDDVNNGFTTLGTLDNVIIFVARNDKDMNENNTTSYAANPNTIEVGYVQNPPISVVEQETQKLSFAGLQKDRVVNMESSQTGKMKGDGFCTLGQWSTSEATALMTGMAANLRAQNPNWTKDEVISILRRDAYKSSEYQYDANGWNERTGWGIVQPGKTMKENIFPEFKCIHYTTEGIYRFRVDNFNGAPYHITGDSVQHDSEGYFVDLSKLQPGKHTFTFIGKCYYDGAGTDGKWKGTYDFPIPRVMELQHPTDVNILQEEIKISTYPNPFTQHLTISGVVAPAVITITDSSGRVLHTYQLSEPQITLDLVKLIQGMYFITATNSTKGVMKTLKIMKI